MVVAAGGVAAQAPTCETTVTDGDSIQDAIDAADPGDTICVETGTYTEQLTIDENSDGVELDGLSLVAADGAAPVLSGSGSGTGITIDTASNVTIEGFEISNYGHSVWVENSPDAVLESNTIVDNTRGIQDRNTASHGLVIANNTIEGTGFQALYIQGSDDVRITGNQIQGNGQSSGTVQAIYIRGGSGGEAVTIEDNMIVDNNNFAISIWTPDAVVRNNTISDHGTYAIQLRSGLGSQRGDDALIEANTIENVDTGIDLSSVRRGTVLNNDISSEQTDLRLSATDVTITDNTFANGIYLDGNAGFPATFDHTIDGNTIDGDPIVYLKGETDPTIPEDAAQILAYDSTGVDVSGWEFDGLTAGIQLAYSPGAVVTDNTVTNSTNVGIQLWNSNDAVVENNVANRNVIGSSTVDPAIGVEGSSGATIQNNEITDADGRSILVDGSPNSDILDNTLTDNREGIALFSSDDATVSDNTITGTTHGGSSFSALNAAILVINSERAEFERNHISDNAGSGIHDNRASSSPNALMRDNVITGNNGAGIYWRASFDPSMINNTIQNNGQTGGLNYGIYGAVGSTVTDNTIQDNGGRGIDVSHNSLVEQNVVEGSSSHGVAAGNASVIRNNVIADSGGSGIFLRYFGYQTIESNTVTGHGTDPEQSLGGADLTIFETEQVTVRDNTFETGVQLVARSNPFIALEADLTTHSFSNNTVAGKELYYARGVDNPQIPADPGQVIIVNSTNVDVSGHTFEDVTAPIQVAFSDVTITDNTLINSTGSAVPKGAVTVWASDDAVIADNTLTGDRDAGLRVVESSGVELTRNTVTESGREGVLLEGAPSTAISDSTVSDVGYRGIWADRSPDVTIDDTNVQGASGTGLHIEGSSNTAIANSSITENDAGGVFFVRSTDVAVVHSTITDNSGIGIGSDFRSPTADSATIANNTVTDNAGTGIDFGPSGIEGVEITENTVSRNEIGIRATNDAVVTDNVVSDNVASGVRVSFDPDGIAINFNEIAGNGDGVVYDRATWSGREAVNATYNWWGAANGPSGGETDPVTGAVADGDGDSVDQNVRFDPWIGTSIDVTDASVNRTDVAVGEDVLVTATVENTGSEDGTITLSLEIDGIEVDTRAVPVSAGQTETVEFVYTFGEAGTYAVSVNGVDAGTVTVTQDAAELEYSNLSVSSNQLYTGSTVVVSATVENTGGDLGNYEAPLIVDSQVVETRSGALDAGESQTVRFFYQIDRSGEFDVTIDELPAETVSVTPGWAQFGFGDNNVGSGPDLSGPVLSAEEEWSYTVGSQFFHRVRSSPAVADDVVYVGGGGGQIHAVNETTGDGLWTFDVDGALTNGHAATVNDGVVYASTGATDIGTVYAIDADDGTEEWSVAVGERLTSTVVVDGVVYVGSWDGQLYALDASDGTELWSFDTDRQIRATPAASDGLVYVATSPPQGSPVDEKIHAIDATTGEEVWNTDEWALGDGALAVSDGVLYAGDFAGNVRAFDTADGTQLWETSLGGQIQGAPSVADDIVYVGSSDNHVYALNATTGVEIWSFETGNNVRSSPAIANGVLYVGSYDTNVYALNALTGDELWQFETDSLIWSSPAVLDGTVYIGSDDRHLYAIGEGGPEPNFRFGATLSTETIEVGETVDVIVNVTNSGGDGDFTAELTVDGQVVATQTEPVPSGEDAVLTFTRQFDTPGTYALSVNGLDLPPLEVTAPDAPDFELSDLSVSPTDVETGETVTANATVTNTGTAAGEYTATLFVNDAATESETVELDAGENETVTFSTSFDTAGTYSVTIDDLAPVSVTVTDPDAPAFELSELSVSPTDVEPGEAVTANATVTNTGTATGEYTATLFVDGVATETQTVELDAGESETVSFTTSFDATGTYAVTIGDLTPIAVTVSDPPEAAFELSDLSVSPTDVETGETVTASAIVTNTGTAAGEYTATLFVNSVATENTTITLDAGESETVTFTTSFDTAGTYTVTIGELSPVSVTVSDPPEAAFELSDLSVSPTAVETDETVTANATVTNTGTATGEYTATLFVNGVEAENETITLDAGETETVSFTTSFDTPGSYVITIDDLSPVTVTVSDPEAPDFELSELSVSPTDVETGETVTANATVTNTGTAAGEYTATLFVNDTAISNETVTLDAGQSATVTFTTSFDTAGTYAVGIGDAGPVTVTVSQPDDPSPPPGGPGPSPTPSISIDRVQDGPSTIFTIENIRTNDAFTLELLGEGVPTPSNVSFDQLELTLDADGRMTVTVTPSATPPGDVTPLQLGDGTQSGAYLTVEHDRPTEAVTNARFLFTFTDEALADWGVDAEEITLARYDEDSGDWSIIDTDIVESDDGRVQLAATAPGLSTFAVGTSPPSFSLDGVELDADTIDAGDQATVSGTVRNDGAGTGQFDATFSVDGQVVDEQTVTVRPGESEPITFTRAFDTPGEYDLAINDQDAGTLHVRSMEEDTADDAEPTDDTELTDDTAPTDDPETDDSDETPGFGVLLAVLAVLIAVVVAVAVRRR